jgi:hypothetical protein
MIISGWDIFLIFAANQAGTQIVNPYLSFKYRDALANNGNKNSNS